MSLSALLHRAPPVIAPHPHHHSPARLPPPLRLPASLVLALALALGSSPPAVAAGQPARPTERSSVAARARLAAIARSLTAFPTPQDDDHVLDLPAAVPPLVEALHASVADLAEARLHEAPLQGRLRSADDLRQRLEADLAAVGLPSESWSARLDDGHRDPWFGALLALDVRSPTGDPGMLVVSWEVTLGMVGDGAAVVFTLDQGAVRRALFWTSRDARGSLPRDEPQPDDARYGLNGLRAELTPRDAAGGFFLVTAWSQPGAPSSWGAAYWAIVAGGGDGPRVVASGGEGAFQCGDDCVTLTLDGDQATLEFDGSAGGLAIASGFTTRAARHRWRLVDGSAEELGPATSDPFHFADAWMSGPWERVVAWSAGDAALHSWHETLREGRFDLELAERWYDACPPAVPSRYVIGLREWTDTSTPAAPPLQLYFLVREGLDGLEMVGVTLLREEAAAWAPERRCGEDEVD